MKLIKLLCTNMLMISETSLNIPNIDGPSEIHIAYSEHLDSQTFTNKYFTYSDNKTPTEKLIVKYRYELNLDWPNISNNVITIINEDNYSNSKYFTLYVEDDIGPFIYGPDTISFDYNNLPTKTDIISYYSSIDEVDGPCTIFIDKEITYSTTSIDLLSNDKSNNITTKTIKLNLLNEPKYWYVEATLNISNKSFLSASSIIDQLIETQYLQKIDYLYASYIDTIYEKNYMITGLYEVEIEIYTLELNEPFIIKVNLNIINDTLANQKQTNTTLWWEKIFNFIKNIFKKITNFFV